MDTSIPNPANPDHLELPHTKPDNFMKVALFAALVACGMALYLFWQNQQLTYQLALSRQTSPSPSPSPSADPTTDWQTFSHKSGYSIKYPSSYKLFAMKMNDIDTTPTNEYADIMINTQTGFDQPHIRITRLQVDLSDTRLSIMELAQKYYQANLDMPALPAKSVEKPTITTFAGLPAVTYSVQNKGFKSILDEYLGYEGTYRVIIFEKDGYKYQIYWTITDKMNQIASTFKFTDTAYTLDDISKACIGIRNSSKYWIDKYKECISPDGDNITLKEFCSEYGGKYVENGDSCRHTQEEGTPCGPEAVNYCSFDMR